MSSDAPRPPDRPSEAPSEPIPSDGKALSLDSTERRHLRSLAHPLKPVVFVGEGGVSPAVTKALDEALTSHELVKIRLRQPTDKKATARELAEATASALCGVVGHTVVLYRPHPEEPRIQLPKRD